MVIDKKLYREALQHYRHWNEAELIDSIRNAGQLTPEEGWRQYVDLWEFCVNLNPGAGEGQRMMKLENLIEYYSRVQKFEQLRQDGTKTKSTFKRGG